jgi:hypothetical protein
MERIDMKRVGPVLLGISLSAFALHGQTAAQQGSSLGRAATELIGANQQAPRLTVIEVPNLPGCPVLMHAGHLADGSMIKTDSAHPRGIGQWLSLSLQSFDNKQIAKATLTVHGMTPKGHITQTVADGGPADATQTFHVTFVSGANQAALADLWVPGMSAVERIDLESVGYGDGSVWKVADSSFCQVRPDPFMLITSR